MKSMEDAVRSIENEARLLHLNLSNPDSGSIQSSSEWQRDARIRLSTLQSTALHLRQQLHPLGEKAERRFEEYDVSKVPAGKAKRLVRDVAQKTKNKKQKR